MADDEPLEEWAARRERQRPQVGERRATPLDGQPDRASHVDPDAPRGVQEWDGHHWVPTGVAEDHESAAAATGQDATERAKRVRLPAFSKLPPRPEPWRPSESWERP